MSKKPQKKGDENKAWNRKTSSKNAYKIDSIAKNTVFLLFCEGKNTEPDYFKAFPLVSASVESIHTQGTKTAFVEETIKRSKQKENKGKEIWCVFDFDKKLGQNGQEQDFNEAILLAKKNKIEVAYSNDSFELWFILHYQNLESNLTRFEYYEILNTIWGVNYENEGKKIAFSKSIYAKLLENKESQKNAITRAENLLELFKNTIFAERNPCTTVFELVVKLNKFIKP